MSPKTAAIARWTGTGSLSELRSSVESVLRSSRTPGRVSTAGDSVVVEGPDPLGVAVLLGNMPGVSWVAAGLSISSVKEVSRSAGKLARRYLKPGERFSVEGEGTKGVVGGDVAGATTSGVLDAVRGARVSETPKVRFRAAYDGDRGVVGVEVRRGPGGATMGDRWATCLVSGGAHSALVAWDALLGGYRLRMVHVKVDEASLISVARQYAEFSHRVDPRGLELVVLDGSAPAALAGYLKREKGVAFGGFHPRSPSPPSLSAVAAPLYLLPEEQFRVGFEALGVKSEDRKVDWGAGPGAGLTTRRFEGWADGVSAVLDGLH